MPLATALAARQSSHPQAVRTYFSHLGFDEFHAANTSIYVVDYAHHDLIFHRSIVEAAGKRILLRVWDTLVFEDRLAPLLADSQENLTEVQKAHWDIIDALGTAKGVEAGRLLRRHIGHFSH